MSDLRRQRLLKQFHKDMSDIFLKINKNFFNDKMISVSEVRLTSDLSIAKIYLSCFPSKDPDIFLDKVNSLKNKIRFELGNKIKNQMRKVPELRFFIDNSFDEIEKIDELLKKNNR